MRSFLLKWFRGAAVLAGAAVASVSVGEPPPKSTAPAEPIKPAVLVPPREAPREAPRQAGADGDHVYRMEIYEGPNRTVRYFGVGASPSERAALNDLERAENEMSYLNRLQDLRRLYVNNELTLQPLRLFVQEQLYGTQLSYSQTNLLAGYGYGWGGGGYSPGVNAYGPYTGSYYPYGGWGGGFNGYLGGATTNVVRSLAIGMGDEGVLKNNMSPVIAQQAASPEYAAQVTRNYHAALAEAATYPRLARSLGLRKSDTAEAAGTPDHPARPQPPVSLTLKGGEKVEGTALAEEGDWYVVTMPRGQTQVRKSEVTRIDRVKPEK